MVAPKAGVEEFDALRDGLRMLWALARHTPVDIPSFAVMNALSLPDAARFMAAFEHGRYVRRVPFSELYVLTTQAVNIVSTVDRKGALIASAIDPLVALGRSIGQPVTLHIRKGVEMLCCVVSHETDAAIPKPGDRVGLLECLPGLVHIACSATGALDQAMHRMRMERCGMKWDGNAGGVMAVPVVVNNSVVAVLALHFSDLKCDRDVVHYREQIECAARFLAASTDWAAVPVQIARSAQPKSPRMPLLQ